MEIYHLVFAMPSKSDDLNSHNHLHFPYEQLNWNYKDRLPIYNYKQQKA